MIGRIRNRFKSVYPMILLSYFAMLVTFFVTGLLLMRQSEAALTAEIIAANQASMRQMGSLIDEELRSIERLCYEQSLGTDLNELIYTQKRGNEPTENKRRMSAVTVVQGLYAASIANHATDLLYLLTTRNEEVLTQNGKYTLPEFFQRYYAGQDEIDQYTFLKLIVQTEYAQYITLPSADGGTRDILYLYALPVGAREKLAVMGARVNAASLRNMLENSKWLPDTEVVLLDQNGGIILSGGPMDGDSIAGKISWSGIAAGQPAHIVIDRDRYTVMVSHSECSPFLYGVVVPSRVFLLSRHTLMTYYAWCLVILLVIGVVMAILMANVQYRPIRHLADSVLPTILPNGQRDNEYRLIEHRISTIKSEINHLSHANKQQLEQLRIQRLISILHGVPTDECEIRELLRNSGVPMRYSRYVFILIFCRESKAESENAESAARASESHAMQLVAALPADIDLLSIVNRNMRYLLLNLPDHRSEQELFSCCQNWQKQNESADLLISVGHCFQELSGIHHEFLLVSEVMEYQFANGQERIMNPDLIPQDVPAAQSDGASDREKIDKKVVVTEAVALIEERYRDQMLSVTGIADEFGISQVALTRAFKHILDIGVLDFIHKTRLNIAKQLIVNTSANLLDIAQQVGYTNSVTFIRVFKKYEGVTPSQYRAVSARQHDCE